MLEHFEGVNARPRSGHEQKAEKGAELVRFQFGVGRVIARADGGTGGSPCSPLCVDPIQRGPAQSEPAVGVCSIRFSAPRANKERDCAAELFALGLAICNAPADSVQPRGVLALPGGGIRFGRLV